MSEQSIEELQQRYNKLNTRRIQAETNLKHATDSLEKLKKQAREAYGTDDVDELRNKLAEMKRENEEKRKAYQESLDKIEADLKKVDDDFEAIQSSATAKE